MAREVLNERESKFIALFEGSPTDAARRAGYKNPTVAGIRLMKRPAVVAALKLKQQKLAEESGKKLGRAISVTRNDIIMGLVDEARKAESDSARVSAWGKLADIFQLTAKIGAKDADMFAGWSDEELEQYRLTGVLPARFGDSVQ